MKNLLIVALAVLSLTSCTREISSLPESTQVGSNTFGAKIDGTLWGPAKFGIAQTAPILEARSADNNSIFINVRNFSSSPTETELEIYLQNIQKTGTVYLNQNTGFFPYQSASYAFFIKRKLTPIEEWMTNSQLGGWVNITKFDKDARIISGTFEFQAQSRYGSAPINVTEGRFDLKIQ
jgi:hypothetical protein